MSYTAFDQARIELVNRLPALRSGRHPDRNRTLNAKTNLSFPRWINALLRLGLGHLISEMFLFFSPSDRSLLLERVAVDDNYSQNLISLLLENVGMPITATAILGVADREKRTYLSRLLKPAD